MITLFGVTYDYDLPGALTPAARLVTGADLPIRRRWNAGVLYERLSL
jgi:hypothetical protein